MQSSGAGLDRELTIGLAGKLTGLTPRAIRYYEVRGLVSPPRDRFGQRRYPREIRTKLEVIAKLRQGGLGITEVQEILCERSRNGQAEAAITKLRDRAVQLAEARRKIEDVIELIAAEGLFSEGAFSAAASHRRNAPGCRTDADANR